MSEIKFNEDVCYFDQIVYNYDILDVEFDENSEMVLSTEKTIFMYPKHLITKDREHILFVKEISRGGFGVVLLYESKNKQIRIALKITNDLTEVGIIKNTRYDKCKIIPAKIIHTRGETFYIAMPAMTENLVSLKIYDSDQIVKLCIIITDILICLKKNGLVYCDLKPENILYRCDSTNTISIVLGDIGGISYYKDYSHFVTTYRPDTKVIADDYFMSWLILVLMLILSNESKFDKIISDSKLTKEIEFIPDDALRELAMILYGYIKKSKQDKTTNLEIVKKILGVYIFH